MLSPLKMQRLLSIALVALALGPVAAFAEYRFVFVSHIGPRDSNAQWFEKSLAAFQEKFPDVKIDYLAPEEYSNEEFVQLIEQAIAGKPDGIAVSIIDPAAIEGALRKTIDQGIPVMAFNTADARYPAQRIPYLAYVGTNSYLDGKAAADHALAAAEAGNAPKPIKVLCVNPDRLHAGLADRCRGMTFRMGEALIQTDTLITDYDPEVATEILTDYLQRHQDINYFYAVTADSAPVVWKVLDDLGQSPDADLEGATVIGVDEGPVSIAGVANGHLLSTISQGFWLQGWEAAAWLYWKNKFGYEPAADIYTGPVVIDKSNVGKWEAFIRRVFGDDAFEKQVAWQSVPKGS
ncbi:MAG: substrate-binding domain-containing protein [Pseudomonadota bacterium]|nr:substrate-binding domain-containing protein [Pseudomonadota bacterium]